MKVEINNENKAKFFALYWGQTIVSHDEYPDKSTNIIEESNIKKYSEDTYFLYLKTLSQISDEDAKLVCKHHRVISSDEKWSVNSVIKLDGYSTDYLRSKGYAIPWMGLSVEEMVEAGWIKLITQ